MISYFFSVLGGSVKIHSVATGHVISTLSTSSSSGDRPQVITSAILNPHNAFQLITGSLNGCIMVWDILDGVVLQTIDISQPIHHICAHEKFRDQVFVAVSRLGTSKSAKGECISMSRSVF
jgi:NET1-associated nuclear protein 1 (U3 small nucleolar RNA-associated protein 17)